MAPQHELGKVCQHDQLKRQCPLCEKDQEIFQLRAQVAEMRTQIDKAKALNWEVYCGKNIVVNIRKLGDVLEEALEISAGQEWSMPWEDIEQLLEKIKDAPILPYSDRAREVLIKIRKLRGG